MEDRLTVADKKSLWKQAAPVAIAERMANEQFMDSNSLMASETISADDGVKPYVASRIAVPVANLVFCEK
ncbi:uncharacterized protein PgNI_02160 [Pyricularia grisea]|uniref:Uncharacterized protein n=1 Tax=Pyricularia grisea TaxID=148305 RepID=A0A6P8BKZ9_PYRGI|nr:uncharacterized protein PgNI_02160 [Pyricularia grisea]TLD17551.1 hypothetical protein PgNI_02160 [Pyricularia grisea]